MNDAIQIITRRRWDVIAARWREYLPDSLDEMPNSFDAPKKDELLIDRMKTINSIDQFESVEDAPELER